MSGTEHLIPSPFLFVTVSIPNNSPRVRKSHVKLWRISAIFLAVVLLPVAVVSQQLSSSQAYWTPLSPPTGYQVGPIWLLTDGTVLALAATPSNCVPPPNPYCYPTTVFRLIPDATGSYANGTWSLLTSMPADYAPVGFASAVLADGKVLLEGGEHNFNNQSWTTKGYLLDPTVPSWAPVTAPATWHKIGDAPAVVLNDGTFMLGDCCEFPPELAAQFIPSTNSLLYRATGGKYDSNMEEGWTLLPYTSGSPEGQFLTVDTNSSPNTYYEIYDSTTQNWTHTSIGFQLYGRGEIGPQVLRADGTVFVVGASDGARTGRTGIYSPGNPGTWTQGPDLPLQNGCILSGADTGAALLTSGNVLIGANTLGTSQCPLQSFFFEFDGTNLNPTPSPPTSTVTGAMLILPTGQVLLTDLLAMHNPVIYTPAGLATQPPPGAPWEPIITGISPAPPFTVGQTNITVSGFLFNGVSQTNMFGDDFQDATNYPLVRLTLTQTRGPTAPVTYCRTHDHSMMVVAAPTLAVSTQFDMPCTIPPGTYYLEVVANGASSGYYGPVAVNSGTCH